MTPTGWLTVETSSRCLETGEATEVFPLGPSALNFSAEPPEDLPGVT